MATARADPLRSTLDNLELDPRSEVDRPYLVAMLRRLGYTERDIEEVIRTGKLPSAAPVDDGLAPARDFRLVVPASDTRFALDESGRSSAPFEDLERLEFEDPSQDLEFEDASAAEPAESTWTEEDTQTVPVEDLPLEETDEQRALREQAERDGGFAPLDQFGNPDTAMGANRTRVRVRRVRAGSKEEAERKVSGKGRTVIKSVPVDIVERWGANQRPAKPADPGNKEA